MQARKQWTKIITVLKKKKKTYLRILYPIKLSLPMEEQAYELQWIYFMQTRKEWNKIFSMLKEKKITNLESYTQ